MARVLLLLPCDPDAPRGNPTTARRIASGLERLGHQAVLAAAAGDAACAPDTNLVVALHARRSGPAARALAAARGLPYAILFTGTDLNGRPPAEARAAVDDAAACVVLGKAAARRARALHGGPPERYRLIRQAAEALPEPAAPGLPAGLPPLALGDELVLVPTGVRAVKAPQRAVTALAALAARRPSLRLWLVGPEIEAAEAAALLELLVRHPWAAWPGPIPRERLLAVVRRAALVLSTSRSEGGPPNALLEAALASRAILASDIPAHREFPGPARLFADDADLRRRVAALLDDPSARARDAARLLQEARTGFPPSAEAAAWSSLVRELVAGAR